MKSRQENGFSLIGMLIGLTITAVVFLAVSSMNASSMQNAMLDTLELNIIENQREIYEAIANPTAWQNTISQNPFLGCIGLQNCQNGKSAIIQIFDSSPLPGHVLAGLPASTVGVSPTTTYCNTFVSAPGGTALCPVRYQVTATISCNTGPGLTCPLKQTPVIKLSGQLELAGQIPPQYKVINPFIYAFIEDKVGVNVGSTYVCASTMWSGVGAVAPQPAYDGTGSGIPVLSSVQVGQTVVKTYPSDGTNWGLQCQSPYTVVGCTATKGPIKNDPSTTFLSTNPAVPVGCYGTLNNFGDSTVTITCCGSG